MPPSLGQFSRQLRSLAPTERAAFVADLLQARGWDVERDECLLVATGDAETRRVHVGPPPPDVDDIDEVVVVPSGFRRLRAALAGGAETPVRDAATGPGVSVLDPAALHQLLLYGVEREGAERLYRDHFDTPFQAGRDDGPATRRSRQIAVAATLLVVVSVTAPVLAGVVPAGSLWGDVGPDTASPPDGDRLVATVTGGEAGAGPPGTPAQAGAARLSSGEVRDPDRLARAHSSALGDHPVAMHASFRGPRFLVGFDTRRSGFDADDTVTVHIHTESDSRYHVVRRTNFTGSQLTSVAGRFERFADGSADYRRIVRENTTDYERRPLTTVRNGSVAIDTWTRFLVFRYLNTTERNVETTGTGGRTRHRLIATGDPLGLDHETRDYRAVAVVEPDGWIRAIRVTYTHPHTGARVVVTARYGRSPGAVDAPEWYDEVTAGSTPES